MRIITGFLITICISTGMMLSAMGSKGNEELFTNALASLGLWVLFFYWAARKLRRRRIRQENEEMFNAYMRERYGRR